MSELMCLEICAGAGGQSRGLELAGFGHAVALEIDSDAVETLRLNRPQWNVDQRDVRSVSVAVVVQVPKDGRICQLKRGEPAERVGAGIGVRTRTHAGD